MDITNILIVKYNNKIAEISEHFLGEKPIYYISFNTIADHALLTEMKPEDVVTVNNKEMPYEHFKKEYFCHCSKGFSSGDGQSWNLRED